MKIDKIKDQLKDLTPQQKLEILKPLAEKEKSKKNKKEIQFLIEKINEERLVLEEEIEKLQTKPKKEENPEEQLEEIVDETIEENPQLKQQKDTLKPYGLEENKPESLYGTNTIKDNLKYLSPNERKEKEYQSQPEGLNSREFFLHHTSDESKKAEKERKKYEAGTV